MPPSSQTRDYGALLTTTLQAMQPRIHDNITKGNRFLAWLESKGRTRKQNGGDQVKVGLMHAQNNTADIYSGYGLLDTTPQEGITSAFFDWAQLSVSIAISRKEERQNSGESRILSLLQTKTEQAEASLKELLNNCLVSGKISSGASSDLGQFVARTGRLDTGASGPLPLPALIDASAARSVSIGNINGSTYSFWRNQVKDSAASSFAGFKQEMGNLYNLCGKGQGGFPDLILGDQVYWETYFNALQNQERYVIDDKRVVDVLGGTDALKFRGAVVIWDEVVPDVKTNADVVDGVGTVGKSTGFFITSAAIDFVTDTETDFITTPFVRPENQDAKVAQILWMGQVGIKNRRKLGVHFDVAQNITS
jgi:hypothetical protein